MNPTALSEVSRIMASVKKIASKLTSTYVIACPPLVYAQKVIPKKPISNLSIGAQNTFYEEQGAFTGEISPLMLKDIGITHVIIGHSERRSMGETDEIVAKKIRSTLEVGIHPILCIGEAERDSHILYLDILKNQIKNSLALTSKKFINQLIIAYEPIWAIGAKEAMDPALIEETTIFIRKTLSDIYGHDIALKTPILYGGAAHFRNAPDIIVRGKVDGLLVGRESVNVPGFIELLKAVDAL